MVPIGYEAGWAPVILTLFNDTISIAELIKRRVRWDYNEWWTGKDLKRSGRGVFEGSNPGSVSWQGQGYLSAPWVWSWPSSLSIAEVKNAWSYTSTPQHVFPARYLVKHRDNFTLPYEPGVSCSVEPINTSIRIADKAIEARTRTFRTQIWIFMVTVTSRVVFNFPPALSSE